MTSSTGTTRAQGGPPAACPAPVRAGGGRLLVPGNRFDLVEPGPAPTVSVVVPYFEAPEDLRRLVASLDRQDLPDVDVVVVDDGSARDPAAAVLADRPDVRVLSQADRGFRAAAARNRGARAARGDVVVFLDGDVVAAPDSVRRLVALPGVLDDAVVVGRRLHATLDGLDPATANALAADPSGPGPWLDGPAWLADGYRDRDDLRCPDVRSWRLLISAVMAVRRTRFLEWGGFDESFDVYGGEDWEFAHRVLHRGAVLAHDPAAVVVHNGPDLAGRDELARKTAETTRLLATIPDRTFRPDGLLGTVPRVLVRCHDEAWSDQARVRCLAAVLATWPDATVGLASDDTVAAAVDPRVRGGHPLVADHVEVVVDLHHPVAPSDLAGTLPDRVDPGGHDRVVVTTGPTVVAEVTAARTLHRLHDAAADAREEAGLWDRLGDVVAVEAVAVGLDSLVGSRAPEPAFDRPAVAVGQGPPAVSTGPVPTPVTGIPRDALAGPGAAPGRARGVARGAADDAPVFVFAAGWRSGSTLVQRLLSASGQAWLWGEPFDRAAPLQHLHAQLLPFGNGWPTVDHLVRPDDPAREWIAVMSPPSEQLLAAQRDFVRTLLRPPRPGLRWGCKEVRLGRAEIAWLLALFPAARVVLLVRDPVDAWASFATDPGWWWRWPVERVHEPGPFAARWRRQVDDFLELSSDPRCRLVRHEDVVAGDALAGLSDHTGLRVDRAPLDHVVRGSQRSPRRPDDDVVAMVRATTAPAAGRLGYPTGA